METWLWTLGSVLLVSSASLCGVLVLWMKGERLKKLTLFLVSVAVGALFGGAILHLIPEGWEHLPSERLGGLLVLAGILLFFSLEKFIRWRHCHIADWENHPHPVVPMSLLGDGLHNFLDGMLIAAAYQMSFSAGVATTVAVLLHEIPQEMAEFGVLVHGGLTPRRALFWNFLSALLAFAGALTLLLLPQVHQISPYLLPLTAGCFLYIAGADLVPELQHDTDFLTSVIQFVGIVTGILILALL